MYWVFLEQEVGGSKGLTSAEEIVGNLPKVWRVLMELLSHQAGPQLILDENDKSASSCYKSVETPSGTRMVPSVSKTYIRLKVINIRFYIVYIYIYMLLIYQLNICFLLLFPGSHFRKEVSSKRNEQFETTERSFRKQTARPRKKTWISKFRTF